ncbi:MAG: SPFH domain-containing protein, partial [Acidimicrobiia bacterium]|nr:SPFH domain-containing protein [Acidimicrobiia bacterium]
MGPAFGVVLAVVFAAVVLLLSSLRVISEYERAIHFRLGRLNGAKGPGLILVLPAIDRIERISLRTVALEIPTQELVTADSVTVRVNGPDHGGPPGGHAAADAGHPGRDLGGEELHHRVSPA